MKKIQFHCSDEIFSKLATAAKRAGVKPTDLSRAIFERALSKVEVEVDGGEPAPDAGEGDSSLAKVWEPRSERLYARLTPSEYRAVQGKAGEMGMTPYTWTARLIRAHLIKAPQLSHDETRALREAIRELSYVGRNLNQVAHALNMNLNAKEKATVELIAEIDEKVEVTLDQVKIVFDQNLNRWGV